MSDYLDLETRRNIYNLLEKNPGLHLSKIAELLNLRISLVEYHLLELEKNELVTTTKEIGFKRYYAATSQIGTKEKQLLSVLRREISLRIILILFKKTKASHGQILQGLKISPSTLSYHLQKLVKNGILMIILSNGEKEYSIINEKEIIQVIIKFKPYQVLESFKDIWDSLNVEWQ